LPFNKEAAEVLSKANKRRRQLCLHFNHKKKLFLISSISNDEIILKAVTFVAAAYLHTFTKRGEINKATCHFLSPQRLLIGCDVMIRGYKFLSLWPRQREIAQTRV
jgi:hypothetical protein